MVERRVFAIFVLLVQSHPSAISHPFSHYDVNGKEFKKKKKKKKTRKIIFIILTKKRELSAFSDEDK